jgi:hypothetical protein
MHTYLISTGSCEIAAEQANELGLERHEWVYIPFENKQRERQLLGRRVASKKYLIGGYTEEEVAYLVI